MRNHGAREADSPARIEQSACAAWPSIGQSAMRYGTGTDRDQWALRNRQPLTVRMARPVK